LWPPLRINITLSNILFKVESRVMHCFGIEIAELRPWRTDIADNAAAEPAQYRVPAVGTAALRSNLA
jgi:hypothetical protein